MTLTGRKRGSSQTKAAEYLMTGLVILLLVCAAVTFLAPQFGWRVDAVMSGSMEPVIATGSILINRPVPVNEIFVGDIITFSIPAREGFITHRVIAIERINDPVFKTKGDANKVEDPFSVPTENVVGKVVAHIPYLGYMFYFLKTPLGFILTLVLPGLLIIGLELRDVWSANRDASDEE